MKQHLSLLSLAAAIVIEICPATTPAQLMDGQPTNETQLAARRENFPANTNLPSVFFIGDSTVRNGRGNGAGGQWGWGDQIAPFFDTSKINVVNRALGGTTTRTYYRDFWTRTLALMKPGDVVLMQFGTNGGEINDAARARGEIHGIGDETQDITNLVTKKFETVHSFGWYEMKMVEEARAKGVTPIICSLIPRNVWHDGVVVRPADDSAANWAKAAAKAAHVPFIDLHEIIARRYDSLGEEKVKDLFVANAGPHTSLAGAQTNAICVVAGLKALPENPLAKYFSNEAGAVTTVNLSQPEPARVAGGIRAAEDERPVVDASKLAVETIANAKLPTLHLVGDSTVKAGGSGLGLIGWGERIKPFFDTNKINVVNDAIGGRSARTYFNEGRWQKVADTLKPGDFVAIQFGHNDQGRIGDPANKHRADGKGIGDETVEDTLADGSKEQVHTFGWYMSKFAADAKAHGATLIICSPIPHKQRWKHGRDFEALAEWDKQVADKNGVIFLDLTMVVTDAYKKAGAEKVETYFADKGTHTSDAGAQLNAACVVAGLKSLSGNPLGKYFSEQGNAIPPYRPSVETVTNPPAKSE